MRVSKILPSNKITSFTSNNEEFNIIGYDDDISKANREYIRQHYESWNMPYQSIYEKEPRLEEYSLQKMISTFAKKPRPINGESILSLPLYNIRNISSSPRYQPNIYRGQTLYEAPAYCIETIKKAGTKTVIDLAGYGDKYRQKINEAGMEFMNFDINRYWYKHLNHNTDERKYISDFVKFIRKMQEEFIYIGCEFGTYKTDMAIMLNKIFNPKIKQPRNCTLSTHLEKSSNLERIYELLTDNDKVLLGWDKNFNAKVRELLKSMK